MTNSVDLNCDMGEGFALHEKGPDAELIKYITSANIACGFHAGDFSVMQRTVLLAKENNVSIGAHPSLPDPEGFGRREMSVTPADVYAMTLYQVGALSGFTRAQQVALHHVKPHGALYNMAAKDLQLADAIVQAIVDFDPSLILYGLAGSALITSAKARSLVYCEEVFADRTYADDGSLTPRTTPGALIERMPDAVEQVVTMIETNTVKSLSGKIVPLVPGTICLHGDGAHAVEFARVIHQQLKSKNITLASPSKR